MRILETIVTLVLALLIAASSFYLGFTRFDFIGVPTTKWIIRRMMPRPEHFHVSNSGTNDPHRLEGIDLEDRVVVDKALSRKISKHLARLRRNRRVDTNYFQSGETRMERAGFREGMNVTYHRPSITKYGDHQWLWDSCFHSMVSIAMSRLAASPTRRTQHLADALEEIVSLFSAQNVETGFIPEMLYWTKDPNQQGIGGLLFGYHRDTFTDLTQMPMLMFSVHRIAGRLGELNGGDHLRSAFLERILPLARQYLDYWLRERDPDENGLVSIIHPWESGLDASPLYDPVHGFIDSVPTPEQLYPNFIVLLYRYRHRCNWNLACIQSLYNRFDVEDVAVNSVVAAGYRIISQLSADNKLSKECYEKFRKMKRTILDLLWDEDLERFVSRGWIPDLGRTGLLTAKTIQLAFPLLLAEPEDASSSWIGKTLRTLADRAAFGIDTTLTQNAPHDPLPAFNAIVPTTAGLEPAFNPFDSSLMWRGPTWPTTNWFVLEGLQVVEAANLGLDSQKASSMAKLLKKKWRQLHIVRGFFEYYNPLSGEGLGQEGLGMSLAFAERLHHVKDGQEVVDLTSFGHAIEKLSVLAAASPKLHVHTEDDL